jgi:hypothetical protein
VKRIPHADITANVTARVFSFLDSCMF